MKNTKNTLLLLLAGLIFTSCEKENLQDTPNPNTFLEIYSDQLNYNGDIYIFKYPNNASSSYFKVDYNSLPTQRVYWSSPDKFYTLKWVGSTDTIWTPVVNFSTYSDDDGIGHQMVYVNPTLIGDTLNIFIETIFNSDLGERITKEKQLKIIVF